MLVIPIQQARRQTTVAPSQQNDDDWASSFNDLSVDGSTSEHYAPTSSFMLEARRMNDDKVGKKLQIKRRRIPGQENNRFARRRINSRDQLDVNAPANREKLGQSLHSDDAASLPPAKLRAPAKTKRPEITSKEKRET